MIQIQYHRPPSFGLGPRIQATLSFEETTEQEGCRPQVSFLGRIDETQLRAICTERSSYGKAELFASFTRCALHNAIACVEAIDHFRVAGEPQFEADRLARACLRNA